MRKVEVDENNILCFSYEVLGTSTISERLRQDFVWPIVVSLPEFACELKSGALVDDHHMLVSYTIN